MVSSAPPEVRIVWVLVYLIIHMCHTKESHVYRNFTALRYGDPDKFAMLHPRGGWPLPDNLS